MDDRRRIESLEDRTLLTVDFGDAPDTGIGTGPGNYSTLSNDNGPSHTIVAGLFLGASVDGEADAVPNTAANGDDVTSALPDDEDGVANPVVDLAIATGAVPRVNVVATNTTGSPATLWGWIDYDNDGVFENASERAQVPVPSGTTGETHTLVFPPVPSDFTGSTYARFRLSTDNGASSAAGPASDGEVEDYPVMVVSPSAGTVGSETKISDTAGGFSGVLVNGDRFGSAVANLGDIDGDGVIDLAVGATGNDDSGDFSGAVYVLLMDVDGSVRSEQKINSTAGGLGGTVDQGDVFGSSLVSPGDLDGDGVNDLAVGAFLDDDGGDGRGAIWILFLNSDGTVKADQKISDTAGGFGGALGDGDAFGYSVTSLGDLDGDGVPDLAVGSRYDRNGGTYGGAVWVLFMNSDGTVKSEQKISDTAGGFAGDLDPGDRFSSALANLGDVNGDGTTDLAVGAVRDDDGGTNRGAVWVLFLNSDGTVVEHQKISSTSGGFGGTLFDGANFGGALAGLGDLDGDGISELAVGFPAGDATGDSGGASYILFLNDNGAVGTQRKISDSQGGFAGGLDRGDRFGISVAGLGDLTRDGLTDVAVGAYLDDDGGSSRGAVWILNLAPAIDFGDAPDPLYNTLSSNNGPRHGIVPGLFMGATVDGETEAAPAVGANGDDVNSADDEDGLPHPEADLTLTIGAQPAVNVIVTNTTGSTATLTGWIDYNSDGTFDNVTERVQATVNDGTDGDAVTLTFPAVPGGFTGTTFARFRLSTDPAASDPTGAAVDGEVEDHAVTIIAPSGGQVSQAVKISEASGNFAGPLRDVDLFGSSLANIGDIDGDGIDDLAAGAPLDDDGGTDANHGAVWLLFMNADGSVRSHLKYGKAFFGGSLLPGDQLGSSVVGLGDLNSDGVSDVAFGFDHDDVGGTDRGLLVPLFLNPDGTRRESVAIASDNGNFTGTLDDGDLFASSLATIGDVNGDGVTDLAVGATGDDDGGTDQGAVWVLFLSIDGTVAGHQKISATAGNFTGTLDDDDRFGSALASLGDINGDGVPDLAVGASGDDDGGTDRGAVWLLMMNADGTVQSSQKISSTSGSFFGTLSDGDGFGTSLSRLSDLNADGTPDLAVGSPGDDDGGTDRGAVWILRLDTDGTVKSEHKISSTSGTLPGSGFTGALDDGDSFGRSLAYLGDLNNDGYPDLAVGADRDDDGGADNTADRGAVWILFLGDLTSGFTFTEAGGSTVVDETGSSDSFDVMLDSQPASNVVINVISRDTGEATVDTASLTFTPGNWNQPQTVTVTGVDDNDIDGDQATTVSLSIDDALSDDAFDGLADQTVTVTTTDDEVAPNPPGLDPDGNGVSNLFTDGILIARYMAGFRGTALTDGALGTGATRTDAADIATFLDSVPELRDVDGNGSSSLFTDGILIARYLAGFRDAALVDGALGGGATRTDPQDIADFLDIWLPGASPPQAAPASLAPPETSPPSAVLSPARTTTRLDDLDRLFGLPVDLLGGL